MPRFTRSDFLTSGSTARQGRSLGRLCRLATVVMLIPSLAATGCGPATTMRGQEPNVLGTPSARQDNIVFRENVPTELSKTTLPTYQVAPPDILLVDSVKLVPKAPYHLEALDVIQLTVPGALPDQPLSGQYPVDPSGNIDLGPAYGGRVKVTGMTTQEVQEDLTKRLAEILSTPEVTVTLLQSSAQQQVTGDHIIGPDGTITLGYYGSVYVAGMTLVEARHAIEDRLSQFLEEPKVSVDVFAYNSKVYYIISEGAGNGDTVLRVPITGNETVLDALAQINGLTRFNSKKIWIARPAPGGLGCDQILPVNWTEITKGAATATNYQILPGDRVFLSENKLLAFEATVLNVIGPFERIFGFTLLGAQTVRSVNTINQGLSGQGAL